MNGIDAVNRLNSSLVQITPAKLIPDADKIVSGTVRSGICGAAVYNSSVRSNSNIREATKPEAAKKTPAQIHADECFQEMLAQQARAEQREAEEAATWIVTENAVGVRTYTRK